MKSFLVGLNRLNLNCNLSTVAVSESVRLWEMLGFDPGKTPKKPARARCSIPDYHDPIHDDTSVEFKVD